MPTVTKKSPAKKPSPQVIRIPSSDAIEASCNPIDAATYQLRDDFVDAIRRAYGADVPTHTIAEQFLCTALNLLVLAGKPTIDAEFHVPTHDGEPFLEARVKIQILKNHKA